MSLTDSNLKLNHEGIIQQEPVKDRRGALQNFCLVLERCIDNFLLHVGILGLCIGLTVFNFNKLNEQPPNVTDGAAWIPYGGAANDSKFSSIANGILLGYVVFDIVMLIATSQVRLAFSLNWIDLLLNGVALGFSASPQLFIYLPQVVLVKFILNHPRYVDKCRTFVCLNKRMYQDDTFHLDLTFLTSRVIAMGLPVESFPVTLWRNRMQDVSQFFWEKYPRAHLIVNMCDETTYDPAYFHIVEHCPTPDHEVPTLHMLLDICQIVERFLYSVEGSVVAFHCKGGKGRTGLVATCWLLYSRFCTTGIEAIKLMADRRTEPMLCGGLKTVTTSCQIRFLLYFEALVRLHGCRLPSPGRTVCLTRARLSSAKPDSLLKSIWIRIRPHPKIATWSQFDSKTSGIRKIDPESTPTWLSWHLNDAELLDHNHASPTAYCTNHSLSTEEKDTSEQPSEIVTPLLKKPSVSSASQLSSSSCTRADLQHGGQAMTGGSVRSRQDVKNSSTHHRRNSVPRSASGEQQAAKNIHPDGESNTRSEPANSLPMRNVISVDVMLDSSCGTSSQVICFTWLHADFLEVRQPEIIFSPDIREDETKNTFDDTPRIITVPNMHYSDDTDNDIQQANIEKASQMIYVPLIGLRDFDRLAYSRLVNNLRLDLFFEILH